MFWIGGTKAGALIGEAIVINKAELAQDFAYHIKQRGALLAKGRLLGIQFRELFRSGLYFKASQYANDLAQKISNAVIQNGYALASETETNQIFYIWEPAENDTSVLRLCTSWATDEAQVEAFIKTLK